MNIFVCRVPITSVMMRCSASRCRSDSDVDLSVSYQSRASSSTERRSIFCHPALLALKNAALKMPRKSRTTPSPARTSSTNVAFSVKRRERNDVASRIPCFSSVSASSPEEMCL
jgi:hypothetical protein